MAVLKVYYIEQAGSNTEHMLHRRVAALLSHGGGCSRYVRVQSKDLIDLPETHFSASSQDMVHVLSTYMPAYQCLERAGEQIAITLPAVACVVVCPHIVISYCECQIGSCGCLISSTDTASLPRRQWKLQLLSKRRYIYQQSRCHCC